MDFGISNKRALVLGASRGLGAAIVEALAREGVLVTAAARNVDAIRDNLATMSADLAARVTPLAVDLADPASVAHLIETVVQPGDVDILVNNGGGPKPGPAEGQTPMAWEDAFRSMALPLFAITNAALPAMQQRGWGRIITIGSSGVVQPIPNLALSNGVRGAVAGWSKTLAGEVARHGITVNMVLPGRIDTPRVQSIDSGAAERTGRSLEDVRKSSQGEIPVGRYGLPDEFAAAVAFLASRQAAYITGSMIAIDGGMIKGL